MTTPFSTARNRHAGASINPLRSVSAKYLPDAVAVCSFFAMQFALPDIGKFVALTWLMLCAMLILARAKDALGTLRWWPLMLLPIFCLMSFIWSDLPAVSARYGFQFLFTVFLAIFFAQMLGPRRFAIALFISMFAFCLASIASNKQGFSDTGLVLVGFTGSKNAMAGVAQLLFAPALALLFDKGAPRIIRMASVPGMLVALYIIGTVQSAGAILMLVICTTVFMGLMFLRHLTPAARMGSVLAGVLILSPLAFATTEIEAMIDTIRTDVLRKDEGLTGRSYLWSIADDLISRRPILGYGYQSLWNSDGPETTGILRWANLTSGSGFNFHNTYRQIGVDVGLVGVAIFVVTMLITLLAGIKRVILRPTVFNALYFSFFVAVMIRTYVELVFTPFTVGTILLFAACYFMLKEEKPEAPAAAAATR